MENSIEEAVKTMERWVEYEKNNKDKINKADELIYIQETILSDYKKVLKENEILKEEKEQAWEEWNNLEQGSYETEQKLKQQIKELRKENEELNYKLHSKKIALEIYNRYIPKSKVEEKIEELNKEIKSCTEIDAIFKIKQEQILQELLERRN